MHARYFLIGLFAFTICTTLGSCKKLVAVPVPVTELVTTDVFNGDATAIAAQLAVYAQMQMMPANINLMTALSSDEMTNWSSYQTDHDLYTNNLTAQTDGGNLIRPLAYKYIYQENAILENIQASSAVSSRVRKQLVGEADFMRAYWYYYLVSLYGDVPLVMSTSYQTNSTMSRTPASKVYQQIIEDLANAEDSLSTTYLDATDTVVTVDRVRPTTWAAAALLARVYLSTDQYSNAEAQASIIINNNSLFGLPRIDSAFLKDNREAIFQLMPVATNLFTFDGYCWILTTPPTSSSSEYQCCSISPQLLNAFEQGDKRRSQWVDSLRNGSTTWYFPYKYEQGSLNTGSLKEYTMVLRLGEQYLIRAEARAQQNNISGAIGDINVIRTRAGLPGLSDTLNQTLVVAAVAHERQVELFTEGSRWIDLKRTGVVDAVMGPVASQKGSAWQSYQQWYPLWTTDLNNGVNLVQNQGY